MNENVLVGENKINTGIQKEHQVVFHGKGGEYFKIWFVNILLTCITLGIYSAWATVRTRKYFYGNTEIDGDRFDYHAKPLFILIGRIIVIFGITIYAVMLHIEPMVSIAIVVIFMLLAPVFILRSWRFNAIMTGFRGIRFNYHCHYGRGYWVMLFCPLLLVAALGLICTLFVKVALLAEEPLLYIAVGVVAFVGLAVINAIMALMHSTLFINHSRFGDKQFFATLNKHAFIKIELIAIAIFLLSLVAVVVILSSVFMNIINSADYLLNEDALGGVLLYAIFDNFSLVITAYLILIVGALISTCYRVVAVRNYIFNQTTLNGDIGFKSTMKTLNYMGILFANMLITIITLGLAAPVAHIWHARYMAENTKVLGDITLANVSAHHDQAKSAIAEEFVNQLDINIGL